MQDDETVHGCCQPKEFDNTDKRMMRMLDKLQRINDCLYKHMGLNRITLDLQVFINTRKFKKDEDVEDDDYIQ